MAKLTLNNLINILERKNIITEEDIREEQRKVKEHNDSLLFKNLLSKEEFKEVKDFLETKVLEHYKPTGYASAMRYWQIVEPLARNFEARGGVADITEVYKWCYALRKELTPSLKSAMHKLEDYVPDNTKKITKGLY